MRAGMLGLTFLAVSTISCVEPDPPGGNAGAGSVATQRAALSSEEKPIHESYTAPLDDASEPKEVTLIAPSDFPRTSNRRAAAAQIAIGLAQREVDRSWPSWDAQSLGPRERQAAIAQIKRRLMGEENLEAIERSMEVGQ